MLDGSGLSTVPWAQADRSPRKTHILTAPGRDAGEGAIDINRVHYCSGTACRMEWLMSNLDPIELKAFLPAKDFDLGGCQRSCRLDTSSRLA